MASVLAASPAAAQPVLRHQVDQRGDFVLLGNVLAQDCLNTPPPVPPQLLEGTIGTCGTNTVDSAADVFWTIQSNGTAFADLSVTEADARTRSALVLPAGARVTYARLYWGANRHLAPNANTPDTTATFGRPGIFSSNITADAVATNSLGIWAYQSTADVTALVQAHGPGVFEVSGVSASIPPNTVVHEAFMAWWMVVFFEKDDMPLRQLTVFDGLEYVTNGRTANVTISGFLVPGSNSAAKLGVISYEGDNGSSGDQILFDGTALSSQYMNGATVVVTNPVNNFFNGTRTNLGVPVNNVGDLPRFTGGVASHTGIDMDVVDVTPLVSAGKTSANITASSSVDIYWLGGFVTSINTQRPDFTNTVKSAVNLTPHPDGSIRGGDTLEYTVTTINSGDDAAVGTTLTDPLPANVTYVPGSLRVTSGANAGAKTDASGDDQGEYRAVDRTIVVRLGTGANATTGGGMAVGATTAISFRVTVNPGTVGTINNQAFISAGGALGTPVNTTPSTPVAGGTKGPTTTPASGPPAPVVTNPSPNEILPDTMPVYEGTAEPGNTVTVTVDGVFVCSVVASGSGAWSCPALAPLAEGPHSLVASAVDPAGNPSPNTTVPFSVDTGVPAAPVITTPAHGSVITTQTPVFSGTAEPNTSLTLVIDGTTYGPFPVDNTGNWSVNAPLPLPEGQHTVVATTRDAAGNTSPPATSTFTVDLTPPNTFINTAPPAVSNSSSAPFTFSASEANVTYECSLDGAAFVPCSAAPTFTGLADGNHTLQVRAIDAAGHVDATPASHAWVVDTGAPDTTIVSGPAALTNSTSATFDFSSNESGVTYECSLDGAAFVACTDPRTFTGLADGNHTLAVRARDAAGNVDPTPATHAWTVDTSVPDTTIVSGPAALSNSSTATFDFTSNESGVTYQCRLDGGAFVACTDPRTFTGLADGSHTLEVRAVDAAGNVDPTPATYSWTVDTTPPDTTIVSGPPASTSANTATFDFSSNESGVTYECRLDGGAYAPCTDPRTFTGLANGGHTLEVRAIDAAGNVDPTPATYNWTVTAPASEPDTSIVTGPAPVSNSTTATFDFNSNESGVTYECSLDGAAFVPCSDPATFTNLAEGDHALQVRARNGSGVVDSTPATWFWAVDTTAPDTVIVTGPAAVITVTTATFDFESDEENATYECSLDGAAYVPCSDPLTLNALADGQHTLLVRAIDAGGNVDPTPASHTWVVDTTPPDTFVDSGPAAVSNSSTATFDFSSNESGVTYECRLDGGAYAPCSDPATYTNLLDGTHTLEVRAIDAVGHVDPTPAVHNWTVDTTPPDTTFVSVPPVNSNSPDAVLTFEASEAGSTFECSVDGGAFVPCGPAALELEGLADGDHVVEVRARDAAGNVDPTPATYTWSIDAGPPDTFIATGPDANTSETSATFDFNSNESGVTYECSLDGAAFVACSDPVTFSSLSNGEHTLAVRARDAAGNVDPTPATHTWTVDTLPPDTMVDSGPAPLTSSTSATFEFSANEAGATYECSLDGGPFTPCTDPVTFTGLADGPHQLQVRAVDTVGNVDPTPAVHSWTVDSSLPDTTILTNPPAVTNANTATFTFESSEPASTFECRLDGGAWEPCTGPVDFTGLTDGSHTFEVRALDPVGNPDPTPASYTWTVDTGTPAAPVITGPADGVSINDPRPDITGTGEPNSSLTLVIDGTTYGPIPVGSDGTWTFPVPVDLADGPHTVTVTTQDAAGNVSPPASSTFTVDTAAPDTSITSGPAALTNLTSATFEFDSNEAPVTYQCSVDGGAFVSCTDPQTFSGLTEGAHELQVRAIDAAGNVDPTPATYAWTIDLTAPAAPAITGPVANEVITTTTTTTYTGTAEPGSLVTVTVDGTVVGTVTADGAGNWSLPSGPLTDGPHTVSATATDAAGNTSPASPSVPFVVDTHAPDTSFVSTPPAVSNSSSATFSFTANEPSTFECRLDGGAWTVCTGPLTINNLTDGSHTLEVRATDTRGNVDPTPATYTWTVTGDTDGDGLTDDKEAELGTDPTKADTDGDGIPDGVEVNGDNKTDPLDDDSDDDGLMDGTEDANHDGIVDAGETDPNKADTDEDGLQDGTELGLTQPEGTGTDATKFVADADPSTRTDPLNKDTDGGSVFDGAEDRNRNGRVDANESDPLKGSDDKDADGDGLDNELERELGLDPFDSDSDDDGVPDGIDGITDTDKDGKIDALDPDSDNDGLLDGTELGVTATTAPAGTNKSSPNFVPDADPSTKTDPKKADTDGDGLKDGVEDKNKNGRVDSDETDPNDADTDKGGANDGAESQNGGNPLDPDDDFTIAGRGCSASGSNPLPLVALLFALPLLRRRRNLSVKAGGWVAAVLALLGVVVATPAAAQPAVSQAVDVQQYKPGPGASDVLGIYGTQVGQHLDYHLGLSLNYSRDALGVFDPREDDFIYQIVKNQFTADLMGSISLFDRFELGLALPVTFQSSQDGSSSSPVFQSGLSAAGLGDLRIVPKAHLLKSGGFDLGLVVPILVPTGGEKDLLGSAGVGAQPRLIAEWRSEGGLRILANAGANFRREQDLRNVKVGNELAYGLGAEVPLTQKLALQGTLNGSFGLRQQDEEEAPLELLAALKYRFLNGLAAHVGAGPGITRGYGTPGFRLFAGLGYTPEKQRPAPQPLCELGPEDLDGFQDDDQCLDPDNDGDGLADVADLCPNEAETVNGFHDEDGCPDEDAAAGKDSKPIVLVPGGDSDKDGIPDEADRCPMAAEDADGFEDEDGCPDPDNDRDGVADAVDQCPLEAETINSVKDEDGCPDKGSTKVRVEAKRIVILEKVHFATAKDVILARSFPLLEQVASVLRANPQIELVRVEGHTDDQGSDATNLNLSQRRANNVRAFLEKKGIAAERMEAVGYGETKPVDTNKTARGRENNRRVVFNIVKVAETPVTAEDGETP
ncbi:Ig-like domain-containing protein [Myxococcaceae bacterium GXIMD 01537]